MDVVKCYAWEASLKKRVDETRDVELSWIKRNAILRSFNSFLIAAVPVLVSVGTFLTYIALGNVSAVCLFVDTVLFLFVCLCVHMLVRLPYIHG